MVPRRSILFLHAQEIGGIVWRGSFAERICGSKKFAHASLLESTIRPPHGFAKPFCRPERSEGHFLLP
jgi:hypothetical protein